MLRTNNMARANGREFDRTYDRLERAAVAAARRNNAMLLYVPDAPGAALQFALGAYAIAPAGSPVGRLLDMQYGAPKLGPELVANGNFETGAGWTTIFGAATVVSGRMRLTRVDGSTGARTSAPISCIPGRTYRLSVDRSVAGGTTSAGAVIATTFNSTNGNALSNYGTSSGVLEITFVATQANHWVILDAGSGTAGQYSEFDSVSVREVIDAPGSRGPELINNGDFTTWSADNPAGWTVGFTETATEFVTQASPGARLASAGAFNEIVQAICTVGKTYEATVVVAACSGNGALSNNTNNPISFTAPGIYRAIFTAAHSNVGLKRALSGTACDFTVTSVSIREVFGYHCNQATASSKPTVVKIPRRTGPELVPNGRFETDASGWTVHFGTGSVVGGRLRLTEDADGTGVRAKCLLSTRPGASYQVQVDCTIGTGPILIVAAVAGDNTAYGTNLGRVDRSVTTTAAFSFVATSGTTSLIVSAPGTDGQFGEFDNVSVKEVLEWSNAIQFDGTDDFLDVTFRDYYAAGTSTFVGSWYGPVTGNSSFGLVQSSNGNITPLYAPFGIPTSSVNASYFMRDDAGSAVLNFRTYAAGAYSGSGVVSAVDSGNRLVGLDHGTVTVDVAFTRPGVLTSNRITVGAAQRTSTSGFGKMIMGLLCWSPNVMPDADRRAIEKFAAFLVGEHHV